MDRDAFYRLAEWKRNDLKRKVGLYWTKQNYSRMRTCSLSHNFWCSC